MTTFGPRFGESGRPKGSPRREADLVWLGAALSVLSALIMVGIVWLIIKA